MNDYIFYTTEGHTDAPNAAFEIENCQVIGIARGASQEVALSNLLSTNPWIAQAGFDTAKFIVRQILTSEQRADILTLINNLEKCEVNMKADVLDIANRLKEKLYSP